MELGRHLKRAINLYQLFTYYEIMQVYQKYKKRTYNISLFVHSYRIINKEPYLINKYNSFPFWKLFLLLIFSIIKEFPDYIGNKFKKIYHFNSIYQQMYLIEALYISINIL